MASVNETPTYNLKAVVQETNLKPDTLRAWERRYGLPQPERTSGGHRIYSQRDIEILKWLIARQDEGLSISRAVALWQELEAEGIDPLEEYGHEPEVPVRVPLEVGETLVQMRASWIQYCLDYEEQKSEYVLAQAFALYPPETVCLELLQKGLAEIGQRWYAGEVTAQQEHFASALALRRLESLLAATPPPTRPGRILIGCPPEEEHTFSPLLLTLLLRRLGWEALYLGANVPLDRMEKTISRNKPRLVILSAQTLYTAATLREMAQLLHAEKVQVAYGGLIFNMAPSLRERIPGRFLGTRIQDAPVVVEQLMASPSLSRGSDTVNTVYLESLQEYRQHQAEIEAQVWQFMNGGQISQAELRRANFNLARDVSAALALGDMDLLGYDLEWLRGLMTNHNYTMEHDLLCHYLRAYHTAARNTLGDENDNVALAWLDQLVAKADAEESEA